MTVDEVKKRRGRPAKKDIEGNDTVLKNDDKVIRTEEEASTKDLLPENETEESMKPRAKKSSIPYKEDSEKEGSGNEGEEYEDEESGNDDDNSGDDFDPKKATKKSQSKKAKVKPSKIQIKKSGGRGRPKKVEVKKVGKGRQSKDGEDKIERKKAKSPVHYLYDLSDSSDTDVDDGARSDASDDWNYRPHGDVRVKKRKISGAKVEDESDDGDNWRPGKAFPGLKVKAKARKASGNEDDLPPKKRGRPSKNKESEIEQEAK